MANMVIPNEGKLLLAQRALRTATGDNENYVVDLFTNNYTPVDSSTGTSFTVATFTGYAQVAVASSAFNSAAIASNVAEIATSAAPTFTCSGGTSQTCYGWFMRGVTSGKVYAAQRFDVARVMSTGTTEALDPFKFSLKTFA